jgi:hypothetical protein
MISEPLKKSKQHSTVKTASFSKRLENKKLLMSQKNSKDHKIWVDIQVEQIESSSNGRLRSNQQLYFAASNKNARTNTAAALKPMQIYMMKNLNE